MSDCVCVCAFRIVRQKGNKKIYLFSQCRLDEQNIKIFSLLLLYERVP